MVQKMYLKHSVSCTNTHHDVTDLVNHWIFKSTKTWISRERKITLRIWVEYIWKVKIVHCNGPLSNKMIIFRQSQQKVVALRGRNKRIVHCRLKLQAKLVARSWSERQRSWGGLSAGLRAPPSGALRGQSPPTKNFEVFRCSRLAYNSLKFY